MKKVQLLKNRCANFNEENKATGPSTRSRVLQGANIDVVNCRIPSRSPEGVGLILHYSICMIHYSYINPIENLPDFVPNSWSLVRVLAAVQELAST